MTEPGGNAARHLAHSRPPNSTQSPSRSISVWSRPRRLTLTLFFCVVLVASQIGHMTPKERCSASLGCGRSSLSMGRNDR
jgi:hypothetical protein